MEDNPREAELFWEALLLVRASLWPTDQGNRFCLCTQHTADAALWHLRTAAEARRNRLPRLVVADFDLPGGTALRFLREMRQDARIRSVPLIVLACVDDEASVAICTQLGVNTFIVKPSTFAGLVGLVRDLCSRWLLPAGRQFLRRIPQDGQATNARLVTEAWSERR